MASAIFSMSDITEQEEEETGTGQTLIRQYGASEQIPGKELPLQDLLHKQPVALGVAQLGAGITSFGLGVTLAVTSPLSLAGLLRVPILTGLLYIICGLLSSQLNRFTRLLPICFVVNIGCLSVAGVGIVLLAIDLSLDNTLKDSNQKAGPTKVLILCVIALMACVSALLVLWLHREMRSMRKKF